MSIPWQPGIESVLDEYGPSYLTGDHPAAWDSPVAWGSAGHNLSFGTWVQRSFFFPGGDAAFAFDSGAIACAWLLSQTNSPNFNGYLGSCPTITYYSHYPVGQYGGSGPLIPGYAYRFLYSALPFISDQHRYGFAIGNAAVDYFSLAFEDVLNAQYGYPAIYDLYDPLTTNFIEYNDQDVAKVTQVAFTVDCATTGFTVDASVHFDDYYDVYLIPPGGVPLGQWLDEFSDGVFPSPPGTMLGTISGGETKVFTLDEATIAPYVSPYDPLYIPDLHIYFVSHKSMGDYHGEAPTSSTASYTYRSSGGALRVQTAWTIISPEWRAIPKALLYGWGSPI